MTQRLCELPRPFPYQQEIILDDHRFKVWDQGRQGGKTLTGGVMVLDGHGPIVDGRPKFHGALHGGTIWWVSRDYPTATRIWRDLKSYFKRWGGTLDKSEQERSIHFPGGGSITIKSASDPDSLRGATLDGLVGDEVAFWNPDALNLSLRPALAVKQGWFVLISTPDGLNFFYDEWRKGAEHLDPDYRSWKLPSSVNPALAPAEIERMRSALGSYGFQKECMAEFEVREGGLFRREWFQFYKREGDWVVPVEGAPVRYDHLHIFMAADLALTAKNRSDFTATCVVGRAPDGRIFVLEAGRSKMEVPEVVPCLARIMTKWDCDKVILESSGPLVHLNNEAERVMPGRVRLYKTHEGKQMDKVERAGPCAAAVEGGRVLFLSGALWFNALCTEMCAFPDPHVKDDQVDAISLCVLCAPPVPAPRPQRHAPVAARQHDEEDAPKGWQIGR